MLDGLAELNQQRFEEMGDPEITIRIAQYEMAYKMQTSVPDLVDISKEPKSVLDMYGPDVTNPGTFAYNCLLARRLAERGVPFTQVFLRGWDPSRRLPGAIRNLAPNSDQASAALVKDLKRLGMLDDTLVVWAASSDAPSTARNPDQGQLRPRPPPTELHNVDGRRRSEGGLTYGQTDDFSYNVTENPVHIHDLNATILHCLGVNHEKLTYKFQVATSV